MKSSLRRLWYYGHLVLGLFFGGVLVVSGFTGLVMSVQPILLERVEAVGLAGVESNSGSRLTLDAAVAKVSQVYPDLTIGSITVAKDPSRPWVVTQARKRGGGDKGAQKVSAEVPAGVQAVLGDAGVLWVNPTTGEVAPAPGNGLRNAYQWLLSWHRWLGGTGKGARAVGGHVTGAACLAMLGLLVSGLVLWGPVRWWRRSRAAKVPRGARGWHETAGLAATPLLLVIGLSGVVLAYHWAGDLLFTGLGKGSVPVDAPAPQAGVSYGTWQGRLERTQAVLPAWDLITVRALDAAKPPVSGGPSRPPEAVVSVVEAGSRAPVPTWLRFSPETGAVVRLDRWAELSWRQQLRQAAKAIHSGEAFGVTGLALGALASASLLFLAASGFWMFWKRQSARR